MAGGQVDYDFLTAFAPKIVDVTDRAGEFWVRQRYVIERDRSELHVIAYIRSGLGYVRDSTTRRRHNCDRAVSFISAPSGRCISRQRPGGRSRSIPFTFAALIRWDASRELSGLLHQQDTSRWFYTCRRRLAVADGYPACAAVLGLAGRVVCGGS